MKVLLIDNMRAFLDYAMRLQDEGHQVRVWMADKNGQRAKTGNGLITRVPSWESSVRWADIIISSDNARHMRNLESLRRQGYPVINIHGDLAEWELNRSQGQKIFQKASIPTLESTKFTSYDEAIAFVDKTRKRYVSKPDGDADKAMSYVSSGPKEMIAMLQRWKKTVPIKEPFILQEFVPGIEMAIAGWFGPGGFSAHFLENFEFKKFMNDDYGVNTGEQGTLLKYTTESKLADKVLRPLEGELYRQGYVGFIDVAVIVDSSGTPWPLEFTCARFGWPLFQIQQELHPEGVEWMRDLFSGFDSFKPKDGIAAGVVVSMPDYPYSRLTGKKVEGFPIWGITDRNKKHVHLSDAMLGNGPDEINGKIKMVPLPVTCGDYVYVASGVSNTVKGATEKAYKITDEVTFPNSPNIRTDIGKRLEKELPKLQTLGYATGWKYD